MEKFNFGLQVFQLNKCYQFCLLGRSLTKELSHSGDENLKEDIEDVVIVHETKENFVALGSEGRCYLKASDLFSDFVN